jgi:hypothetical protein
VRWTDACATVQIGDNGFIVGANMRSADTPFEGSNVIRVRMRARTTEVGKNGQADFDPCGTRVGCLPVLGPRPR